MVCRKSVMGWCSVNVLLSPGVGGANTISKITPSSPLLGGGAAVPHSSSA